MKSPVTLCTPSETAVMDTQQHSPRSIGFPPLRISFTILVFSPIAPIAIAIKNLASHFAKIIEINEEQNRVSLSIRALKEEMPEDEEEEAEDAE